MNNTFNWSCMQVCERKKLKLKVNCVTLYTITKVVKPDCNEKTSSNFMLFVAVGEYSYVLLMWRALARVTRSRIDDDQIR